MFLIGIRNGLTVDRHAENLMWQPCLLTDQDEMSNLYRGPSIDASYQVSVAAIFQFYW
jgi:hypothetical protein